MKILYITNSKTYNANTVYDYDSAFSIFSRHDIFYFDVNRYLLDINFSGFDIIIFSYAFAASSKNFPSRLKERLRENSAKKIFFFQDEYTSYIKHKDNLKEMGIDALVTVMPKESWPAIYGSDKEIERIPKLQVLTGYIPDYLKEMYAKRLPLKDRQWFIGYRSRTLPPIFGRLVHEKYEIGVKMKKICRQHGLSHNIEVDKEKRIYGKAWPDFIRNCRLVLGTESGCNLFDFTGEISLKIADYQKRFPDADFWEIHENCIGDADGAIRTNQISPRIFEAMSLGTGHILYEGEYSGILKPWRHYIPLKKDYSNIDEVLQAANDDSFVEEMINRSYEDIVASGLYSYKNFIHKIDDFIDLLSHNRQCSSGMLSARISEKVSREAPYVPSLNELEELQKVEVERVRKLGVQYSGKKILAIGAGEAFKRYKTFFSESEILGIAVDDYFYPGDGHFYNGIPIVSMYKAGKLAPAANAVILFCRHFRTCWMHGEISIRFPANNPIQVCTLYA